MKNYWEGYDLTKWLARAEVERAGIGAVCRNCGKLMGAEKDLHFPNICQCQTLTYADKLKAHGLYEFFRDKGEPPITAPEQYRSHG